MLASNRQSCSRCSRLDDGERASGTWNCPPPAFFRPPPFFLERGGGGGVLMKQPRASCRLPNEIFHLHPLRMRNIFYLAPLVASACLV